MVGAEDGGGVCRCLVPVARSVEPTSADPSFRENHSLTSTPSDPPMASQLARILSRRMSTFLVSSALGCLIVWFRNTRLGAEKCVVQVCHASDESYHD